MRVAILAHEKFPDRAKTAVGVLRYADHDVVALLDRETAGDTVHDHVPDVQDAPIVASMSDVEERVDALIVGIAPIGGGFDESWRPDIRTALQQGCDVIAGLHYFLEDDDEFSQLADDYGCELWDVRKPHDGIGVAEGVSDAVSADIVLTVGTDCSVGKMTTSCELVAAAKDRGIDAAMIPTGQTGIMIEGWGNPVDRVVSDFTAGAVEEMILEKGNDHDLLIVEGQGSIVHPAYSAVTCGILHGAMPDALVLCHTHGRESVHGYDQDLPPLPEYVDLYESLVAPVSEAPVVAGALDTRAAGDETAARRALGEYSELLGVPATDPVRFGVGPVLEEL